MKQEKLSYADAVAEIEEIIRQMSENELDVDKLGEQVARATSLISLCKEKLNKAQEQVDKAIKSE